MYKLVISQIYFYGKTQSTTWDIILYSDQIKFFYFKFESNMVLKSIISIQVQTWSRLTEAIRANWFLRLVYCLHSPLGKI